MVGKFIRKLLDLELDENVKQVGLDSEKNQSNSALPDLPNLQGLVGFYSPQALTVCQKVYQIAKHYQASSMHHHNFKGGLWKHSIEVAEEMARKFKDTKKSYIAFLVGLLHDVGKIAFYNYESRFIFHPLSLLPPPEDFKITGTKKNEKHAELSSCLVFYFVYGIIDTLTVDEFMLLVEAIRYHHSNLVVENEYLDALKEIDSSSVVSDIQNIITQQPESKPEPKINLTTHQPITNTAPEFRDKIDLSTLKACFRKLVQSGDFIQDYNFYLVNYEEHNLLLITHPKSFHELLSKVRDHTGMLLHDSLFIDALLNEKWIAMRDSKDDTVPVKVTLKFNDKNRVLKFIVLHADKFFTSEEIKQFLTKSTHIKIRGKFIE